MEIFVGSKEPEPVQLSCLYSTALFSPEFIPVITKIMNTFRPIDKVSLLADGTFSLGLFKFNRFQKSVDPFSEGHSSYVSVV